jgi:ABC-type transport system involved in multi-copper enzyme maturation permease subunit
MIRAEVFKARMTRSVWVLAGLGVAFCVAWAAVQVFLFHQTDDAYAMAQQAYLFAMIIGIQLTAGEYRHQTITWALLVTPRRGRVITGKFISCGLIGVFLGIAAVAVTAPVTAVLLAVSGNPVITADVPAVLLGSILSTALWCVFGAAVGLLVRNQIAANITAFMWFFYAEWFLVMLLPSVGRWTPTGTSKAIVGWDRGGLPVPGDLLPVWAGTLVFLGYAVIAAVLARLVSVRRDVT